MCAHVDHRKVFEQLASNGSSANHECLQLCYFLSSLLTDNDFQASEAFLLGDKPFLDLFLGLWAFLQHFVEMEGEELLDGHVFVGDCFYHLLGNDTAEVCTEGGKLCLT